MDLETEPPLLLLPSSRALPVPLSQSQSCGQRPLLGKEDRVRLWILLLVTRFQGTWAGQLLCPHRMTWPAPNYRRCLVGSGTGSSATLWAHPYCLSSTSTAERFELLCWQLNTLRVPPPWCDMFLHDDRALLGKRVRQSSAQAVVPSPALQAHCPTLWTPTVFPRWARAPWCLGSRGSHWAAHWGRCGLPAGRGRGPRGLLPQTGSTLSRFQGPSLAVPWIPPRCPHPLDKWGKWPQGKAGSIHLQIWCPRTSARL